MTAARLDAPAESMAFALRETRGAGKGVGGWLRASGVRRRCEYRDGGWLGAVGLHPAQEGRKGGREGGREEGNEREGGGGRGERLARSRRPAPRAGLPCTQGALGLPAARCPGRLRPRRAAPGPVGKSHAEDIGLEWRMRQAAEGSWARRAGRGRRRIRGARLRRMGQDRRLPCGMPDAIDQHPCPPPPSPSGEGGGGSSAPSRQARARVLLRCGLDQQVVKGAPGSGLLG
jgi:hypothetical protein